MVALRPPPEPVHVAPCHAIALLAHAAAPLGLASCAVVPPCENKSLAAAVKTRAKTHNAPLACRPWQVRSFQPRVCAPHSHTTHTWLCSWGAVRSGLGFLGVGEQPLPQDSRSGEFSKIHWQTLSQSHPQSKALGVGYWLRIQSARVVQVDGSNVRRNGWCRSIPLVIQSWECGTTKYRLCRLQEHP